MRTQATNGILRTRIKVLLSQHQKAGNDLKMELSSSFWTHPAGQTGLVERLVCGDDLGVTQQGHRQLGRDADLKGNGLKSVRRSTVSQVPEFPLHVPAAPLLWRRTAWRSSAR